MADEPFDVVDFVKRMSPYFLVHLVLSSILAVIASVVTLHLFLGWNFESIHNRIDDSNRVFERDLDEFSSKLTEAVSALSETKTISASLSEKIDQLDEDILFIRRFTTEFSNFEEAILYGPEIIPIGFGREPIGGPGEITPCPTLSERGLLFCHW